MRLTLIAALVVISTVAQAQLQMQEQSVGGPMHRAPMPAGAAPAPPPTRGIPLGAAPRRAGSPSSAKTKKSPKVEKPK